MAVIAPDEGHLGRDRVTTTNEARLAAVAPVYDEEAKAEMCVRTVCSDRSGLIATDLKHALLAGAAPYRPVRS